MNLDYLLAAQVLWKIVSPFFTPTGLFVVTLFGTVTWVLCDSDEE